MKTHRLKTWPVYFDRLMDGSKTFELRKNDRDFQTGDDIICEEWNPEFSDYTGRKIRFKISYLLNNPEFGIYSDWCVLGLHPLAVTSTGIEKLISSAISASTLVNAHFSYISPEDSYPTNEKEADDFIKNRIKLYMRTWIESPLREAIKIFQKDVPTT